MGRALAVLASTIAALTVSGGPSAHAAAAVTAPSADQAWRVGETKNITWSTDGQTGTFSVELWTASQRIATLGAGADVAAGTFRWTIPNWMPELVVEDVQVKIVPATGDTITSSTFDLRRPDIGGIMVCWHEVHLQYAPQVCVPNFEFFSAWNGQTIYLAWGSNGPTGTEVKIDVVQVEGSTTTVVPVVKKTPNDGREYIKLPQKLKDSGWYAPVNSYIRITPILKTADAGTSGETPIFVSGGTTPWRVDLMAPEDITQAAGQRIDLDVRFPETTDPHAQYLVGATSSTGEIVEVYRGPRFDHPMLRWAAPSAGTWTFWATTGDGKGKKYTSTRKLIATANDDEVRQATPSDATVGSGQPITINWAFYDDSADTTADEYNPGVDITVVNAAGKTVATIAKARTITSTTTFEEIIKRYRISYTSGSTVWRPAPKLPAGTYKVRVARTGTTTYSEQEVVVAHPTTLTASWTAADVEPGEAILPTWSFDADAAVPVDIVMVTGSGKTAKTLSLAKKVDGTTASVIVPLNAAPGSYNLVVRTSDKYGTTKQQLVSTGITFNVVAPTITATSSTSVTSGADLQINWDYGKSSTAPVKLELFKGSGTKPVKTIARSAPGASLVWNVPVDLAAGTDYFVRATSLGTKPAATDDTPAIAVTAPMLTVTDSVYTAGLTVGETVATTWTTTGGADQTVAVSLLKGTKVVAKLSAKVAATDGNGRLEWVVPAKLTAGEDYTLRITDTTVAAITDDSAAFTIKANTTTIG